MPARKSETSHLVTVRNPKTGESIKISPLTLENHKQLGFTEVIDAGAVKPAEEQPEAAAE